MMLRYIMSFLMIRQDLILHLTDNLYVFVFFFFQAEDGIRDLTVTGVQTCALPIWTRGRGGRHRPLRRIGAGGGGVQALRFYSGQRGKSRQEHTRMTIKVAINGFGRIGRMVLRAHYESGKKHGIQFVAINDLGDAQTNAHLLKYDTAHGPFPANVRVEGDSIVVNNDRIKVVAERDPAKLPWRTLGVDVVMECTGLFTSKAKAGGHIQAGARKVIISAPGEKDVDRTVVFGVNHRSLKESDSVISNASCTTNCLAPLVKAIDERIGVASGLMNTIHSFTNDQVLTDVFHKDLRRARAAGHNMIPTKTGAAAAVGLVLPHLNGKLDGYSIRVPTINVSIVDLTFVAKRPTTVDEVNKAVKQACDGDLKGVLAYSTEPLVSSDFNHNPASSIFDSTLTRVSDGTLVKVSSWYDNEWGFSNRMLDVAAVFAEVGAVAAK